MKKITKLLPFLLLTLLISCSKNNSDTTCNCPAKQPVIVILGSSTAFGTGASLADSSWVGRLALKFKADKLSVKIVNLAVGGSTTYSILPSEETPPANRPLPDYNKNITKALSYNPDLVIINFPSNDIAANYSDNEIETNFIKVSDLLRTHNTRFLITSTQPRNFSEFEKRRRLKEFNLKLNQTFPSNTVDYYNLLADDIFRIKTIFNSGDGVHLNDRGHRVIYENILNNVILKKIVGY